MSTTISAIYEGGAFHPTEPVTLEEASQVQVLLEPFEPFFRYLMRTRNALVSLATLWEQKLVYRTAAKLFQDDLLVLAQLCPVSHRELGTMLILATQHIVDEPPSDAQAVALQFALDKLEQETLSETDIDQAYERLIDAGLHMSFCLGDDALEIDIDG